MQTPAPGGPVGVAWTWWLNFALTVVTALAGAGMALLYRGFRTGKWVQNVDNHQEKIDALNRRLDKAGQEMSDLTDLVQKLPDQFRIEFVSKEVFTIHQTIAKEQRDAIWDAINGRMPHRR